MRRTYVIAEAGVNHNGNPDTAIALVEASAAAEADAVKFQTFSAKDLVSRSARKAAYQQRTTDAQETQYDMLRRLELSPSDHRCIQSHCQKLGIEFLSTPFDIDSLTFLVGELALSRIKVSSGDITNAPFLLEVALTQKPVILSTGMSTLDEVTDALGVLAYGYLGLSEEPGIEAFQRALNSVSALEVLRKRVTLLHCTSEYPAPLEEVNLRAMDVMRERFGLPLGYSDHTMGIVVPVAAVARGACLIEKHITLNRELPGPDHAASLEPDEFKAMVTAIREVEIALGNSEKIPTISEMKNRVVARKSLVANRLIRRGDLLTRNNIGVKRPGTGLSPFTYWQILGSPSNSDYEPDDLIEP